MLCTLNSYIVCFIKYPNVINFYIFDYMCIFNLNFICYVRSILILYILYKVPKRWYIFVYFTLILKHTFHFFRLLVVFQSLKDYNAFVNFFIFFMINFSFVRSCSVSIGLSRMYYSSRSKEFTAILESPYPGKYRRYGWLYINSACLFVCI